VNAHSVSDDAAAIERGRLLFARPVLFRASAPTMDVLPDADRPEVALAGRSNVGKSSLLNALAGRRDLARSSAEPGRTRELIFFDVGAGGLYLVDMPGYGFARAPKAEIARWTELVQDYLRGRPTLRRVFLLIDARHGLRENDGAVMDALDASAVSYQIVLTKIDSLRKAGEDAARIAEVAAQLRRRPAAHPVVLAVSAHAGAGLEALRAEIAGIV